MDRVGPPHATHDLEGVAVDAAGEVVRNGLPGVAPVVGSEELLGGEVEPGVRVGAHHHRGVPVPPVGLLARRRLGLDVDGLTGGAVEPHQPAVLPLAVDDVGLDGIDHGLEAVAEDGDEPVLVADARLAPGAAGPTEGGVVLGAAVDVVEGLGVVDRHAVELHDGQILEVDPGGAAVMGFVDPAVAPGEEVPRIRGVDPESVVVDVLEGLADVLECLSPVMGDLHPGVHGVDPVDVGRIADELVVVVAAGGVVGALLPRLAAVGGAKGPALVEGGVEDTVDHIGFDGRETQAHPPLVHRGQPGGDLTPGLAPVGGLVEPGLGTAVDERPGVPPALVGRRQDGVGVGGVEPDLGDPGVVGDVEDPLPGGAAVDRAIEAAIAAGAPQRTLRRHPDNVGVARVDDDVADVLRLLEAHPGPRRSARP